MKALLSTILVWFLFLSANGQNLDEAIALRKAGKYEKAVKLLNNRLKNNPEDLESYVERAHNYLALREFQKSYDDVNQAIKLNPKTDYAYVIRARIYIVVNEAFKALNDCEQAIKYAKHDSVKYRAIANKAEVKYLSGHYQEARELYEQAITYFPYDYASNINLALTLMHLKKHEEGLKYLDSIMTKFPDDEVLLSNYGYILQEDSQYVKSIIYFDRLLAKHKQSFLGYNNRGFSKYMAGQFEEGKADIEKSLKINPNNSFAHRNLALIYLKQDKKTEACESLNKANQLGFTADYGYEVQNLILKHCK